MFNGGGSIDNCCLAFDLLRVCQLLLEISSLQHKLDHDYIKEKIEHLAKSDSIRGVPETPPKMVKHVPELRNRW